MARAAFVLPLRDVNRTPTLRSAARRLGLKGPAACCPAVRVPATEEQSFGRQDVAPGATGGQGCQESLAVGLLPAGAVPGLLAPRDGVLEGADQHGEVGLLVGADEGHSPVGTQGKGLEVVGHAGVHLRPGQDPGQGAGQPQLQGLLGVSVQQGATALHHLPVAAVHQQAGQGVQDCGRVVRAEGGQEGGGQAPRQGDHRHTVPVDGRDLAVTTAPGLQGGHHGCLMSLGQGSSDPPHRRGGVAAEGSQVEGGGQQGLPQGKVLVPFLAEAGHKLLGRHHARAPDGLTSSLHRHLEEGVWLVHRWLSARRPYRPPAMHREASPAHPSEICVSRALGSESRANSA